MADIYLLQREYHKAIETLGSKVLTLSNKLDHLSISKIKQHVSIIYEGSN